MGITYGTEEKIIFGEPVLGMVLGPLLGMLMGEKQGVEVGTRGSGYGKSEGSCFGETILLKYFCVCFVSI